jgi:hypothetical protein
MIFGQLRNSESGIRDLLLEESKRSKQEESFYEMLERTPKLETPKFNIIYNFLSSRSSHVRKYESFSVCSLVMNEQVSQQGIIIIKIITNIIINIIIIKRWSI